MCEEARAYLPEGFECLQALSLGGYQKVYLIRRRDRGQEEFRILKLYKFPRDEWDDLSYSMFSGLQAKMKRILPIDGVTERIIEIQEEKTEDHYVHVQIKDFVKGKSLWELFKKGGMPLRFAVRAAISLLEALQKVHKEHVVHGDLKMSQIIVGFHEECRGFDPTRITIMDFDSAVVRSSWFPGKIEASGPSPVVTKCHVPPEVLQHNFPDKRWDVYAAGVVVTALLTGRIPCIKWEGFEEDPVLERLYGRRFTIPFSELSTLFDNTPVRAYGPELEKILQSMLSRDPRKRPSLKKVIEKLEQFHKTIMNRIICWNPYPLPPEENPLIPRPTTFYINTKVSTMPWWKEGNGNKEPPKSD